MSATISMTMRSRTSWIEQLRAQFVRCSLERLSYRITLFESQ
jgi:hypothetical protein